MAAAAAPEAQPPLPATDFALVASGGISLGSYQAGVSYSFLRWLIKGQFDPANRLLAPAKRGPGLNIATGASAGNINAFLAAATWFDPRPLSTSSTDNAFWDTWINIGFEQLSPTKGVSCRDLLGHPLSHTPPKLTGLPSDCGKFLSSDGLVTRAGFKVAENAVKARFGSLANPFGQSGDFKLGITLTRSRPQPQYLQGAIGLAAQRVAVPLLLVPDGPLMALRNVPAGWAADHPVAGATTGLPVECDSSSSPGQNVSPDALTDVIEASSAFPVAFAPMNLVVEPPSPSGPMVCLDAKKQCHVRKNGGFARESACASPVQFYDGGVFDNVPLGLAMEFAGQTAGRPFPPREGYFYVQPDQTRFAPDLSVPAGHAKGMTFALDMFGKFFNEARTYELQGIARFRPSIKHSDFVITSRFFPVVGEYLAAFGAFMSIDYRVHDYLIGLYDGLYALALREARQRGNSAEASNWTAAEWETFAGLLLNLADSQIGPAETVPPEWAPQSASVTPIPIRMFIRSLLDYELRWTSKLDQESRKALVKLDAGEEWSWCSNPVWAVHRALRDLDGKMRVAASRGDPAEIAAVTDEAGSAFAFFELTEKMAFDRDFNPEATRPEAIPPHGVPSCKGTRTDVYPVSDSPSGELFWNANWKKVRGLEEQQFSTLDRLIQRAKDIQREDELSPIAEVAQPARTPNDILTMGQVLLASFWERQPKTFDLDPGSVSRTARARAFPYALFHLLPYYLSDNLFGHSLELGWEPKLRSGAWAPASLGGTFLSVGAAYFAERREGEALSRGGKFSLGLGYDPAGRLVDDLGLRVIFWRPSGGDLLSFGPRPSAGLELGVELASKVRLTFGFAHLFGLDREKTFTDRLGSAYFGLGLADLNGVLAAGVAYFVDGHTTPPEVEP